MNLPDIEISSHFFKGLFKRPLSGKHLGGRFLEAGHIKEVNSDLNGEILCFFKIWTEWFS